MVTTHIFTDRNYSEKPTPRFPACLCWSIRVMLSDGNLPEHPYVAYFVDVRWCSWLTCPPCNLHPGWNIVLRFVKPLDSLCGSLSLSTASHSLCTMQPGVCLNGSFRGTAQSLRLFIVSIRDFQSANTYFIYPPFNISICTFWKATLSLKFDLFFIWTLFPQFGVSLSRYLSQFPYLIKILRFRLPSDRSNSSGVGWKCTRLPRSSFTRAE